MDRGAGSAAFDGLDVIAGQETIAWNAALRFVVGEQAAAACYDQNGNMTWRLRDGVAYEQTWSVENRLVAVTNRQSGEEVGFAYDADGVLAVKTASLTGQDVTTQTYYVGPEYKVTITRLSGQGEEMARVAGQPLLDGLVLPPCQYSHVTGPPMLRLRN